MFDTPTTRFLEGGCALIIGVAGSDGEPYATRGWGLDVLSEHRVRLLLAAADERAIERLAEGGAIAVTACDVRSLRSLQIKGRALGIDLVTDADRERADRYCEAFFTDVSEVDGVPRERVDRLEPADYVPVIIEVEEQYDQTPGPGAGARLESSSR